MEPAQDLSFTDKQLSALFSIVKAVHSEAIHKRLTIDRSFDCFKQVLLRHSVHRYLLQSSRVLSPVL